MVAVLDCLFGSMCKQSLAEVCSIDKDAERQAKLGTTKLTVRTCKVSRISGICDGRRLVCYGAAERTRATQTERPALNADNTHLAEVVLWIPRGRCNLTASQPHYPFSLTAEGSTGQTAVRTTKHRILTVWYKHTGRARSYVL